MANRTGRVAAAMILGLASLAAGQYGLERYQRSRSETAARRADVDDASRREREASRARLRAMVGELSGKLNALPSHRPSAPVPTPPSRAASARHHEPAAPTPPPPKPTAAPEINDHPLQGIEGADDVFPPPARPRKIHKRRVSDHPLDGLTL